MERVGEHVNVQLSSVFMWDSVLSILCQSANVNRENGESLKKESGMDYVKAMEDNNIIIHTHKRDQILQICIVSFS